jgi:hypothetical protein
VSRAETSRARQPLPCGDYRSYPRSSGHSSTIHTCATSRRNSDQSTYFRSMLARKLSKRVYFSEMDGDPMGRRGRCEGSASYCNCRYHRNLRESSNDDNAGFTGSFDGTSARSLRATLAERTGSTSTTVARAVRTVRVTVTSSAERELLARTRRRRAFHRRPFVSSVPPRSASR